MKDKIGILGNGEVGAGLKKVYEASGVYEIKVKDLNRDDGLEGIKVLNICIPYTNEEKFIEIVSKEIERYNPPLTIIHSTVAPGTTKKLVEKTNKKYSIVHSPIRGIHPNLDKGILTFVKFVGGEDEISSKKAKEHLESIGVKAQILKDSTSTELGKLLDTTYYGIAIAFHGEMMELCKKYGSDFDEVVTDFNKTYNEGYTTLGKPNVVRPVLSAPENKTIGGHCVIPNAKILQNVWETDFIPILLKYEGPK